MAGLEAARAGNRRDALWLLAATMTGSAIVIPLQVAFGGDSIYLVVTLLGALANVLALGACRNRPVFAVQAFSWVAFVAIVGMLAIDAATQFDTFPTLANLLSVIAIGAAYVVGLRRSIPHLAANAAALIWLAVLYGLSDTVPILATCIIGGVLMGRLRDELHRNRDGVAKLEGAIRTYVNIKRNGGNGA